jgi:hypothetical protein
MTFPVNHELDVFSNSPASPPTRILSPQQHRPAVAVHIGDGLEVETRIKYGPNGAVVINVYRRPLSASEEESQSTPSLWCKLKLPVAAQL